MKASSEYSEPQPSMLDSHHFGHASSQLHHNQHKHAHHRNLVPKNISQSAKHPSVFRLKTIALIILILISIFLLIDICLYFYMTSHQPPKTNLSFINGIVKSTINMQQSQEVKVFLTNIMEIRPQFYFQYSSLVIAQTGKNFTIQSVKNKLFRNQSENLLYILSLYTLSTLKPNLVAIFVPSYFGIPQASDYNNTIEYYTIDSGSKDSNFNINEDKHQSFIISLATNKTLSMRKQISSESLLDCKTYLLSQPSQQFELLSAINIDFQTNQVKLSQKVNQKAHNCFDNVDSASQLKEKLSELFDTDFQQGGLVIDRVEVYYLTNQN